MALEEQQVEQQELFSATQFDHGEQGSAVNVTEPGLHDGSSSTPNNSDLDEYYMQLSHDFEQKETSLNNDGPDIENVIYFEQNTATLTDDETQEVDDIDLEHIDTQEIDSTNLNADVPDIEDVLDFQTNHEQEFNEVDSSIPEKSIDSQEGYAPVGEKNSGIAEEIEALSGESDFQHVPQENDLPDLEVKEPDADTSATEEERVEDQQDAPEEGQSHSEASSSAPNNVIQTSRAPEVAAVAGVCRLAGRLTRALLWDLPKAVNKKVEHRVDEMNATNHANNTNSNTAPAEQQERSVDNVNSINSKDASLWQDNALEAEFHSLNKSIEKYHSSLDNLSKLSQSNANPSLSTGGSVGVKVNKDFKDKAEDIESIQRIIAKQSSHLAEMTKEKGESSDKLKSIIEKYQSKSEDQLKNVPDSEEKERIAKAVKETVDSILRTLRAIFSRGPKM